MKEECTDQRGPILYVDGVDVSSFGNQSQQRLRLGVDGHPVEQGLAAMVHDGSVDESRWVVALLKSGLGESHHPQPTS